MRGYYTVLDEIFRGLSNQQIVDKIVEHQNANGEWSRNLPRLDARLDCDDYRVYFSTSLSSVGFS